VGVKNQKTDAEWKHALTEEQYALLRQKGTESPGSGKYYHNTDDGMYHCAGCDSVLFSSKTKFDSGSGWPSFTEAILENISLVPDKSRGMVRIEVVCRACDGHLGHVFEDGPKDAGGKRYCINSGSLNFYRKTGDV